MFKYVSYNMFEISAFIIAFAIAGVVYRSCSHRNVWSGSADNSSVMRGVVMQYWGNDGDRYYKQRCSILVSVVLNWCIVLTDGHNVRLQMHKDLHIAYIEGVFFAKYIHSCCKLQIFLTLILIQLSTGRSCRVAIRTLIF